MLEQIDYQFLDDEDLQNTSLSTAANSSRFLKSLPTDAPSVPLRPLFAELHDVRWLMSELEAEAVLVTIALDLPEIGVRGEAVVTGVEPCPVILPGPGKVVLTTFHHASSDLIDLYLSPQPPTGSLASQQTAVDALLYPQVSRASVEDQAWERIGVTGNHPIWSQDRHDYVAAMDLRVGERLKNLSGDTVWVQQKLPRPGPTPVYNLEVQDEHVYYVGASGVLAHNAGRRGCDETRDELDKVRDDFLAANPDYRHIRGGRDAVTGKNIPEEYLPPLWGGRRGGSYPDLTFEGPNRERIRFNTVDALIDGTMTAREQANFDRIFEQTGEPVIAIPKARKPRRRR